MDEVLELKNQISQLTQRVLDLEGSVGNNDVLVDRLQKDGFVRDIGPKIITYTNPAGKDFYSTFIEANNERYTLSIAEDGYYQPISSVNTSTDTLTIVNHPFSNNDEVTVASSDVPPGGLSLQTFYFVVSATTDTVKLSLSLGGPAVNITSIGSGFHYLAAS